MPRYVALFRGINVGKAKRIAMADLRSLLGKLGVRTRQAAAAQATRLGLVPKDGEDPR